MWFINACKLQTPRFTGVVFRIGHNESKIDHKYSRFIIHTHTHTYPVLCFSASTPVCVSRGPRLARDWVYWVYGAMKQWWYKPGRTIEVNLAALPGVRGRLFVEYSDWLTKFVENSALSNYKEIPPFFFLNITKMKLLRRPVLLCVLNMDDHSHAGLVDDRTVINHWTNKEYS